MIQSLDVFMSKHDIESGARWANELAQELARTSFGILCLTKESLSSSWLNFEAGALVKHADGRACGLLLAGLGSADVSGPLTQFQHRRFQQDEFLHLLKDINKLLESPLPTDSLAAVLAKWWPDIEEDYNLAIRSSGVPQPATQRPEREVLDELVLRVRALESHKQIAATAPQVEPDDVMSRPVSYDSLAWYTLWKFPGRAISEKLQTLLLRDIDLRKYSTIEDLDKVIERARAAVERYASENPDWFQFGTDYITKSLGFIDADFRRRHGFAARTREAFEKYGGLVPTRDHE
jgi:hypothetical protein